MTRARLSMNIPAAVGEMRQAAARGLLLGAEHVLDVSSRRVPLDEGPLQRSGTVSVDAGTLTATVSYDGPYAVRQHEDLTYRHLPGRTAKYLEGPMQEEADQVRDIVAAEIRRATQ